MRRLDNDILGIDDDTVKVQVGIERRAKRCMKATAPRRAARPEQGLVRTQVLLYRPQDRAAARSDGPTLGPHSSPVPRVAALGIRVGGKMRRPPLVTGIRSRGRGTLAEYPAASGIVWRG